MHLLRRAARPRPWRDETGVSAIEFAIVFPVFLIAIVGLLVYAIYFGTVHSVQQLAAEAARASVAGLTEQERSNLAQQHVQRAAASYPLIVPQQLTMQSGNVPNDPNLFQLNLTYDASDLVIFTLRGLVPMPPTEIRRQAVVRRGGY